ncbi:MAG: hypothetical protein H7837_04010 [Magnetococcus sp. MYC-9]
MEIRKSDLEQAVQQQVMTAEVQERLWRFLEERQLQRPIFRGLHILYYVGGMIAIGACSLFMTLGWELFGGWGLFSLALGMAGGMVTVGRWLLEEKELPIPAGILLALTVVLVPLALYGLQNGLGWWAEGMPFREYHTRIDKRWLLMELGSLAAAALLLWRFRLPFAVMPVAVTLWYMSMDLLPFLAGQLPWSGKLAHAISMVFGLGMLLLALWVDLRTRDDKDFAFWLYLFGLFAFWGSLSLMEAGNEWDRLLYGCLNMGLLVVGGILRRRAFAVFGALGVAGYLFHLSHRLFVNSMLFPFVLIGLGLGLVYLGLLWQRHEAALATRYRCLLPSSVREMLERRG